MSTAAAGLSSGIGGLARFTELRQRLFFVVIALVIYRMGTHITLPGVDAGVMANLFAQHSEGFVGMMNMFSGGALERMSIFALGIMPYISASIIVQMLGHVYEPWKQLRKEGETGRRKLTQYTRYLTVVLTIIQAVSITTNLPRLEAGLIPNPGPSFVFTASVSLLTGTMFLMWLGEQITERGVGNGISILIFAGIVAGLPNAVTNTLQMARDGQIANTTVILIFVVAVAVTAFVIFAERGQRRITVNYAKRQQGRRMYAAQSSHLPLKLNMAGVIPPIFASSIILFPTTIAGMAGSQSSGLLRDIVGVLSPGQPIYIALYAAAIIFFCFFYTALIFDPRETAENLKKNGALIPGIRPGEQTARYIDGVISRLTLMGAIYITAVCLLPEFLILYYNVPFYFGGTSLLIIVVVIMDFVAQVQTHLMSHQYESLMKKANLRGFKR